MKMSHSSSNKGDELEYPDRFGDLAFFNFISIASAKCTREASNGMNGLLPIVSSIVYLLSGILIDLVSSLFTCSAEGKCFVF